MLDFANRISQLPGGEAFMDELKGFARVGVGFSNAVETDAVPEKDQFFIQFVRLLNHSQREMMFQWLEVVNDRTIERPPDATPPDWSAASKCPVDLLPEFQALTFAEQVRVRCALWLYPASFNAARVALWTCQELIDHPEHDLATLIVTFLYWAHPRLHKPNAEPYGLFSNQAMQTSAMTCFEYAVALETISSPRGRPHRRRKLKAVERERCLMVMREALSIPADA